MAGTYDVVSWDVVRAAAKLKLGVRETSDYDDDIDYFISECFTGKLRVKSTNVPKYCRLDLEDERVGCLPKGFVKPISFYLDEYAENGLSENGVPLGLDLIISAGAPGLVWADSAIIGQGGETHEGWGNTFTIQNGRIYFNTAQGDHVNMLYYSKNVDDEGYPIIFERYVPCLSFYAAYMVGMSNPNRWPMAKVWQQEFIHAKNQIQTDDFRQSFENNRALIFAMITNPYILPVRQYGRYSS
jgi:hypothetical protein